MRRIFGLLASALLALTGSQLIGVSAAQAATYNYDMDCNYAYFANINTNIYVTLQPGDTVTFTNITTSGNGFCDARYTVLNLSDYFSTFPSAPFGTTQTYVVKSGAAAVTNGRIALYTMNIGGGATNGRQFYFTISAAPTFTATFNANGGTGSMTAQTGSTAANLTSNAFNRTGYTFSGWNTAANGSGTSYANGASYAFNANVTLYAQWTAIPKVVTFDANGGTGSMATQSSSSAANLTPNSFVRTGFTFGGWNTAANGSGTSYANSASFAFAADATLYAQWTANAKTVTFNANGGTGSMASQSSASAANLTPNSLVRTGFTFAGWNTAANGSGVTYANLASYPFIADVTLYAQWTANPKVVTFDANGGTGSMATQSGSTAANLTANTLVQSGFTFAGWNTAANGTGTAYADQASYAFAADVTLYAQWTAVQGGMQQQQVTPPANDNPQIEGIKFGSGTGSKTISIRGSKLPGSLTATIGGKPAKVVVSSSGEITIELPEGLSGFQTLIIKSADMSYQFEGRIRVSSAQNTHGSSVDSEVSIGGFAAGSYKLSKAARRELDALIAANASATRVSCVGYTAGPTKLPSDAGLATARAKAVCDYIRSVSKAVVSASVSGKSDLRTSASARRVEISFLP